MVDLWALTDAGVWKTLLLLLLLCAVVAGAARRSFEGVISEGGG